MKRSREEVKVGVKVIKTREVIYLKAILKKSGMASLEWLGILFYTA
jgi:hypothetical protein